MSKQSGLSYLALTVIIAAVLVLIFGLFVWFQTAPAGPDQPAIRLTSPLQVSDRPATTSVSVSPTPAMATTSWLTYRNDHYGFQLQYPSTWRNEAPADEDSDLDFALVSQDRKINLTVDALLDENDTPISLASFITQVTDSTKEMIQLGDYDVLRAGGKYYLFPSREPGARVFLFSGAPLTEEVKTDLEKIITTFQFTK